MTQYANLPGVFPTIEDGNLQLTSQEVTGDSILIIGTSEYGPMAQPVAVTSLNVLKEQYGRISQGSLVRGVAEAFQAGGNDRDVRVLRIGNGIRASLNIPEGATATGSGAYSVDAEGYQYQDAVVLEAIDPGAVYNQVSVRQEYVDGDWNVIIYNPITGDSSSFTVDTANPNSDADVHNVSELVSAINADTNLNTIIVASYKDLEAEYTLDIADPDVGPWASGLPDPDGTHLVTNTMAYASGWYESSGITKVPVGGITASGTVAYISIDLDTRCTNTVNPATGLPYGMETDASITGNTAQNVKTAGNRLVELLEVYEYGEKKADLAIAGLTRATLDYAVLKSTDLTTYATLMDSQGITREIANAASLIVPAGVQTPRNLAVATADGTTLAYAVDAYVRPGWMTTATARRLDSPVSTDTWTSLDFENAGEALTMVYVTASGVSTRRDDVTISFTAGSPGDLTITFDTAPVIGSVISISYDSIPYQLTEAATLTACSASLDWQTFFAAGTTLVFGAAQPTNIRVYYQSKTDFVAGSDVTISDAYNGVITFSNRNKLPDLPISAGGGRTYNKLHLKYRYMPEWININATAQTLRGGTNGNTMTKQEQYDALTEAYTILENYKVDIIVPMEAYLDDVKTTYDEETGQPVTENAGFQTQLDAFLQDLSDNVGETIGVIGVNRPTAATETAKNSWVTKLTVTSATDTTRGANIMAAFDSKWVSVLAIEALVNHNETTNVYLSTCEALYAGLISSLRPERGTTGKNIPGVIGARFLLSNSQLDTLAGSRYVTIRGRMGNQLVVTSDVTAAHSGSDYRRLSTVRIMKEAMNVVRNAGEPFIGEPNTDRTVAAMKTRIDGGLQAMKEANALQDFRVVIQVNPTDRILGNVRVLLEMVPAFEIFAIPVTVKLRGSL